MNSTADEKKNEDTHETGGPAENEINNLKLYVLGSIIFLTLLGNFLILFLVSSNILLLSSGVFSTGAMGALAPAILGQSIIVIAL